MAFFVPFGFLGHIFVKSGRQVDAGLVGQTNQHKKHVGHFVRQALEMLDYDVVVFAHPVEALEHFRTKSYDYDLLITDMGMPRVSGLELATRAQKIAPGIPIILMSGNSGEIPSSTLTQAGIRRAITKPVSCRDLSIVVREVLDMHHTSEED